jgi:uncharacterized membrane protein YoaK (UPF0700 family)
MTTGVISVLAIAVFVVVVLVVTHFERQSDQRDRETYRRDWESKFGPMDWDDDE